MQVAEESAPHVWKRMLSRSEMSGEVVGCVDTASLDVGLSATVLTLANPFVLGFIVGGLGDAVGLGSGFLGWAVLLVVNFGYLSASVTRLRLRSEDVMVALITRPSDDVAPPLAQVHLLSRRPGSLVFRGTWVTCCGALSPTLGRLPFKSHLRLIPLNTAPVLGRVFAPAGTALTLSPRGRASAENVGAPTRDAPGRVNVVALLMSKTLAALAVQYALWRHVRIRPHSQTAELGE